MRTIITIAIATLLFATPDTQAAERAKSQGQIDAARSALNEFKAKVGDSKIVDTDIAAAEQNIEKAAAALKAGEKMFGGLTDEADAEVRHQTALSDLNLKVAASRLEKARIDAESTVLAKKIGAVQARVKVFDDYRSEIAKLKEQVAANEKAAKEADQLKADKSALEERIARMTEERKELEGIKAENSRLKNELKKLEAQLNKPAELKTPEVRETPKVAEKPALPAPQQGGKGPSAETAPVRQNQPVEPAPTVSDAPVIVPSLPEPVAAEQK